MNRLIPALLIILLLPACQGSGTKQTVGTVGGAALGGLLGSQFGGGTGNLVATGLGVFLGGLVGSEIGKSLDRADAQYAASAQQQAFAAPVGDTISWRNPESGNAGTYTTLRDGYSNAGSYCREFQQSIVVGGRTERATGRACQQPDGSWRIVQ